MKTARELSPADWLTLGEAWLTLTFYQAALATQSRARLIDSAGEAKDSARSASRDFARAQRLERLLRLAGRLHPRPPTCLARSLALQRMLKRRGVPAQIKIGARKEQGKLRAHAWVETHRQPIGEAADVAARYAPFAFANLKNRKFK